MISSYTRPHKSNSISNPLRPIYKDRQYSASWIRLPRRFWRPRSVGRLVVVLGLVVVSLLLLRRRLQRASDASIRWNEETVLGNCLSIEALRHADECFEAFDVSKGPEQPKRTKKHQSAHLEDEHEIPWVSSYGLVLDYDAAYDRQSSHNDDERYTTKRTLKCLTGFHMSIVWDIQFSTPLIQAYKNGIFGVHPDTTDNVAVTCPSLDHETSASMSIKINCGVDIERDAWGHPKTEKDHVELETCIRLAWSWIQGRVGEQYVGPWSDLCKHNEHGELRCDAHRFHLEGAD